VSLREKITGRTVVGGQSIYPKEVETSALLLVIQGPEQGRELQVAFEPIDIGREDCTLTIPHHLISRRHARVERMGAGYVVRDLGSTNGTFVNDARITEQPLKDGDKIRVGKSILKFMISTNPEVAYLRQMVENVQKDALTGIYNKRFFDQALQKGIDDTAAAQSKLGLIVFDIDFFKKVNDSHGHSAGDHVLKGVTEIVGQQVRASDVFARVGGEEFAIVLPHTALRVAASAAEFIRGSVEMARFEFEGTVIPITLSLGVAERDSAAEETAEALYRRADAKLYEAKRGGRNRVCG
jgi:diguanylate cyclase (GGDEF)-like protein